VIEHHADCIRAAVGGLKDYGWTVVGNVGRLFDFPALVESWRNAGTR